VVAHFLRSLSDPFHYAPPKVAINNLSLEATASQWLRRYGDPGGPQFAIVFSPNSTGAGGTTSSGFGSITPQFVNLIDASTLTATLASSAALNNDSADAVSFAASFRSARPVSGAIRATARYPTSSVPGRLIGIRITDTAYNISQMSVSALLSLADSADTPIVVPGSASVEVRFAWNDEFDTDFIGTNSGPNTSNYATYCIVLGIGWPAAYTLDYECIAHYDVHSGTKTSVTSFNDPSPVLDCPIERLAPLIKMVPPVATTFDIIREDSAFLNSMRLSRTRLNNHRSGTASSSSSSTSSLRANGVPPTFLDSAHLSTRVGDVDAHSEPGYFSVANLAGGAAALAAAQLGRKVLANGGPLDQAAMRVLDRIQGA